MKHFEKNRTAAHHAIVRAVVSALREAKPPGWRFFYETPFQKLPIEFEWKDERERRKQRNRRPDCVAYNSGSQQAIFMEFTRAMDYETIMNAAVDRKSVQYNAAVKAARKADRSLRVCTAPLVFGARGSVMYARALAELRTFNLKPAALDKVLAAGVRAAVTAASDMVTARFAAAPRGRGQQ